MRGRFGVVVVACVVLLVVPACLPSFPSSGSLTVDRSGSGGLVVWSRATDLDEGQAIDQYGVEVDGVEVGRVPGSEDSCRLSGLAAGSHELSVTAYDTNGDWSGKASSGARLSTSVVPLSPASGGATVLCSQVDLVSEATIDVDGVTVDAVVAPESGVTLSEADLTGTVDPPGTDLTVKAVQARQTGLADGETGRISLQTSEPVDSVWQLTTGGWQTLAFDGDTGIEVEGEGLRTTIHARDGGRGDGDGTANGAVSMVIALGVTATQDGAPTPLSGVSFPESAPGWADARPVLSTYRLPGCSMSYCQAMVVSRVASSGALQYRYALGNSSAYYIFSIPYDLGKAWSDWLPATGVPALKWYSGSAGVRADGQVVVISRSGIDPASFSWQVTPAVPLPDGITATGPPSSDGSSTLVPGSDGGLWSISSLTTGTWTEALGPELAIRGQAVVTKRADGVTSDMWLTGEDRHLHRLTRPSGATWSLEEATDLGGLNAGSPAAMTSQYPAGGAIGTIVATVDSTGTLAVSYEGGPATVVGTGYVGTPALQQGGVNLAVAAIRTDGQVALTRLNTTSGTVVDPKEGAYVVGQPGSVSVLSPANGAVVAPGTPVTMTVKPSYGATDYRWYLYEVPSSGVEQQVASASVSASSGGSWALPATTFGNGVRYRAQANSYSSLSDIETRPNPYVEKTYFTVTDGKAPAQTAPSDNADVALDNGASAVLSAGTVAGATGYRFTVSRGTWSASSPLTCCPGNGSAVSWTVPVGWLTPGGSYSWSVSAIFSGTVGAPGPLRTFNTTLAGGPPGTPTLTYPANGARVTPDSPPTLVADLPSNGHLVEYRFELWERLGGGRAWVAGGSSLTGSWSVPAGSLQRNRGYEWTVRVYDLATRQLGSWPQARLLTTATDRLGTNEVLTPDGSLYSSNGYRLVMQTDGNLVVYNPDGSPRAATGRLVPVGSAFPYLVMQDDGNLVEYQERPGVARKAIWASGSRGSNAYLVMQGDGNAVIYRDNPGADRTALWASNSLIRQPPTPPPTPGPNPDNGSALNVWKQLGNPVEGQRDSLLKATAHSAAVYQREFGTTARATTGGLLTYTFNLATGNGTGKDAQGNSIPINNKKPMSCAGITRATWVCFPRRVGATVVPDIVSTARAAGGANPAIVAMVQEARPVYVDELASQLSDQLGTKVYTLYVAANRRSAADLNANIEGCDGTAATTSRYRCDFGNALISTVPLTPYSAIFFEHPQNPTQNRAFVSARMTVDGHDLIIGTMHGQCICKKEEPIWAQERDADFELLNRALTGVVSQLILGADWNAAPDELTNLTNHGFVVEGGNVATSGGKQIDFFLSRPTLGTIPLGTGRSKSLTLSGYLFDHKRVAVRWQP